MEVITHCAAILHPIKPINLLTIYYEKNTKQNTFRSCLPPSISIRTRRSHPTFVLRYFVAAVHSIASHHIITSIAFVIFIVVFFAFCLIDIITCLCFSEARANFPFCKVATAPQITINTISINLGISPRIASCFSYFSFSPFLFFLFFFLL